MVGASSEESPRCRPRAYFPGFRKFPRFVEGQEMSVLDPLAFRSWWMLSRTGTPCGLARGIRIYKARSPNDLLYAPNPA